MYINSYSVETYKPELERYGAHTMIASETLFWRDSEAVAKIMSLLDAGDAGDDLRWLIAMRGTDALLHDFGLSTEDKKAFFLSLHERFKKEFNIQSALSRKALSNRYRRERTRIESVMNAALDSKEEIYNILKIFEERRDAWKPAVEAIVEAHRSGQLEVNYTHLLESFVHMFLNRLFRSKQRMQEMVLYDFLYQFYASALAKGRRGASETVKPEPVHQD